MATTVGIVYGKFDRIIRQIILPTNDSGLNKVVLKSDELMIRVARSIYDINIIDDVATMLSLNIPTP
jgi:hypothetical protein